MAVEWWALIVSIIALFVALLKDFIIPTIFKPKLILEGKNDDECVDNALGKKHLKGKIFSNLSQVGVDGQTGEPIYELKSKSRWLRLRLKNKKGFFSKTARNCYVKLIKVKNSKGITIRPFNAFPLMWVSYAVSKNNLAKGEYHLLDLAFETENERVIYPATHNQFCLPNLLIERKKEKLGPDVYTFRLGVYGDNFDSQYINIKVELTQKFGELKFINE